MPSCWRICPRSGTTLSTLYIDFYRVGTTIRANMHTTVNAMNHNFVPVVRTVLTATIVAALLPVRTRTMENATCRNIVQQARTQPTAAVKAHLAAARRTRTGAAMVLGVLATAATASTRQALPVWPAPALVAQVAGPANT